ncbi:MAG: nucleotide exchange factor GrpE [Acidimicrobiales bacterium]|jgi:molecular chaperone GrpE
MSNAFDEAAQPLAKNEPGAEPESRVGAGKAAEAGRTDAGHGGGKAAEAGRTNAGHGAASTASSVHGGGPVGNKGPAADEGEPADAELLEDAEPVDTPGQKAPSQTAASQTAASQKAPGQKAAGPGTTPGGGKPDDFFKLQLSDDLSGLETLLSDDFARISAERDEFLDALKRMQADFDNFRKRTERQQAELKGRASEALVARLLPVLDSLDLAMSHLALGESAPTDEASAALLQVNGLLRDILEREGLERIDAVGVGFDPTIHEATAVDETELAAGDDTNDDEPAGPTVTEVWRSGYRIGDRVIRPAMVRVRR